jgi:hypothetical protein
MANNPDNPKKTGSETSNSWHAFARAEIAQSERAAHENRI